MPNEPQTTQFTPSVGPKKKGDGTAYLVQGLIALGIIIITFVVAIFVYIPYIEEITQLQETQKTLRTEIARLDNKYQKISGTQEAELSKNLDTAKKLIPDGIRLSELATFVNQNAQKFDLEVSRLNLTENKVDVGKELNQSDKEKLIGPAQSKAVILGRIEGPFSLSGKKEDIFRFLDFLVEGGYATNFDRVGIASADQGRWTVTFTAVHHYLVPVSKVDPSAALIEPKLELLNLGSESK